MKYEILHLESEAQLSKFNCGVKEIDDWARKSAHKLHSRDRRRVYVIRETDGVSAVGFFSLGLAQEEPSKLLSPDDRAGWSDRGAPFVFLDYIGVLRSLQGLGLGKVMLAKAMVLTHDLSQIAPVYGLSLRSLSHDTTRYYTKLGFRPAPGEDKSSSPLMILPIFTIKELVRGA